MDKNQLKEFMNAIGMIGETALIFYRSVVEAGGSQEEAMRLTQALISATLFGGGKKDTPKKLINREERNKHESGICFALLQLQPLLVEKISRNSIGPKSVVT